VYSQVSEKASGVTTVNTHTHTHTHNMKGIERHTIFVYLACSLQQEKGTVLLIVLVTCMLNGNSLLFIRQSKLMQSHNYLV